MTHKTVRKVERADRSGYREVSTREAWRLLDAGAVHLEGVDGDQEANTVTYWYARGERP